MQIIKAYCIFIISPREGTKWVYSLIIGLHKKTGI